jgi:DNA polymerase-3 subunit alpha (Gram-positive type)
MAEAEREEKLIEDVFPGFTLEGELEEYLSDAVVRGMRLSREKGILYIDLVSRHWIQKKYIYKLEDQLRHHLADDCDAGALRVRVIEHFRLSKLYTPERVIEAYSPSMKLELEKTNSLLLCLFNTAHFSYPGSDVVRIDIEDTTVGQAYGKKLTAYLENVLTKRCGLSVRVDSGFYRIERHEHIERDRYKSEEAARRIWENSKLGRDAMSASGGSAPADGSETPVPAGSGAPAAGQNSRPNRGSGQGGYGGRKGTFRGGKRRVRDGFGFGSGSIKEGDDPDLLYGRNFDGESVEIQSLTEDSGDCIIRGQICSVEYKETKKGKALFIFAVTDFTDTISAKIFAEKEFQPYLEGVLKEGNFIRLHGNVMMDPWEHELAVTRVLGIKKSTDFREKRYDNSPEKRIELHCHTKMSDMDGVTDAATLVKRAYSWGWKAIAITDHGVVQAFPEANHVIEDIDGKYRDKYKKEHPDATKEEIKAQHDPFKVIYGMEAYIVDDLKGVAVDSKGQSLDDNYVVFDIETTGLSNLTCKIIEIGAVRVENGKIVDRFSEFVNPEEPIPFRITELTSITDEMVEDAPPIDVILPKFRDFCKDAILVAHNADFDTGFIRAESKRLGIDWTFTYVDTVGMAQFLLPNLSRFKLDTVAKAVGVPLGHHHRAVDDAECTANIFVKFVSMLKEKDITDLDSLNREAAVDRNWIRKAPSYHAIILAQNEAGRVNLYRCVSESHLKYFNRVAKLPKSFVNAHHEGLILGSACVAGELYQALLRGDPDEKIARIVDFYDYLEIQPLGNNEFLIEDEKNPAVNSIEDLQKMNKKIVRLGEQFKKPVVATCDVHFIDPQDEIYRRIIMASKKFSDADQQAPLYLRTTEEMMQEFSYLGEEKAREVVIENPNKICDMIERICPIYPKKCPPVIPHSDEMLREICERRAHEIYGPDLPEVVSERLERELTSIISNGYAVMYIIAQKLVWKCNEDGYLVGSRGSVGSSFVATMAGITEVNPLPPHYLCAYDHHCEFDTPDVKKYAKMGYSGCDMPDKKCPVCGRPMQKLGFNIPFETFLGFAGNKEPDIDLNFSGEYQTKAHAYTAVIFGDGQTFKAGTTGTVADKTAYGYVMKYCEERGIVKRRCEIDRIAKGCTGIRRTTGQHPGGIIVLPQGMDINLFTPVQHPADDPNSDIVSTHFDYHSIDTNLLKLDILGHDDPTMIRMLEDLTGTKATEVPLDEPKVMSLFQDLSSLGLKPEQIHGVKLGTLGIPEFGTNFAMQMLLDTKPQNFTDLCRISGLSHGTDVYKGNAETLIKSGTCTLGTAICCRDDIMTYLISMGLDKEESFTIMERVRKGKVAKGKVPEWPQWKKDMTDHGVPEWYLGSCEKIKYMFPKGHAVAYVMMAYRVGWYKVYHPLAYYAAYFSIRAKAFSYEIMCRGQRHLEACMDQLLAHKDNWTDKESDQFGDMCLVEEMYARGYDFTPIDIYKVKAHRFQIVDGKIMPSLDSIEGIGGVAADGIVLASRDGKFLSMEDMRNRAKVGKSVTDTLKRLGLCEGLPESNQISLFDFAGMSDESD